MRLNLRLKKVLATTAAATIMATAVPVVTYAKDYDNHWAKEAITKWSEKEVLEGYEDGTFKPNNQVTRGELAAIIARVFGLTDTTSAKKYTDVEATKWYVADVARVSSAGIMNDYEDGTFKPEQPATREEAAYAIAKAYEVATKDATITFKDQADISDWAEDEIVSLVAGGYLNGTPEGTFRPGASLTRAEAVTMVDKITADLVNVAGIYSQDIEGNLVVNTADVELKDMVITGNLYLAEGIGEGSVKLTNVTVLGDVIVEGGGIHTIHVQGQTSLNNLSVHKAGKNPVLISFGNLVEVKGDITLSSTAHIEAHNLKVNKLVVDGAQEPQLIGKMKIEDVIIAAPTELVLVDGVTVTNLTLEKEALNTTVRGRGEKSSIKNAAVKADGLVFGKGFKYNKDKIVVDPAVTIPPKFPESGGGGGGGGSTSSPVVDNSVKITELHIECTADGQERPRRIEVKDKNIEVRVVEDGIVIEGEYISNEESIQSIKAIEKSGEGTLTISVAGLTTTEVKLEAGQAFTLGNLQTIVSELYPTFRDEVLPKLKGNGLSEDRYNRLVAKVENEYNQFVNSSATSVSIAQLLNKVATGKTTLEGMSLDARTELETAINKTGLAHVSGLTFDSEVGSISVHVDLTVKKDGRTTSDYTLEVVY